MPRSRGRRRRRREESARSVLRSSSRAWQATAGRARRSTRPSRRRLRGLDLDALRLLLRLLRLRQIDRQDALAVRRGDLVGIDLRRQLDLAPKVPVCAFAPMDVLFLDLLLLLLLAPDRQRAITQCDVDVLLVHARQIDGDVKRLVVLRHVELRQEFGAAHWLQLPRWPTSAPQVVEHPVDVPMQRLDLAPQAGERSVLTPPRDEAAAPPPRNDVSACHARLRSFD